MMARITRWGTSLLLLPLLLAPPARAQLDFEALARRYLTSKGIEGRTPERAELETILADHYPAVQVGTFELHFPLSALESKPELVQVRTLALELLGAQLRWAEWLAQEEGESLLEDAEFKQDVRRVTSWIKGWNGRAMARAYQRGERDFILDADLKVVASYQALADYFGRGRPLRLDLEQRQPTHIYLIPQRKEFIELACVFGLVFPDIQFEYWKPGLWGWTFFYFEDVYFLAMEYAATDDKGGFSGDYTLGTPMVEFNKKGLEQQVVQLSLMALFQNTFQDGMPAPINATLSSNLVIDLYGEVDTRTDGDLRGKKTQDRSIFVPGVVSDGVLPPDYADGRFRSPGHGSDHFTAVLRTVQREGAKRASDRDGRLRTFVMLSDDQRQEFVLHAPFLAPEGSSIEPPPDPFLGDYLEFMRSYRICFLDWLRNAGAGGRPESQRAFARLLSLLAGGAEDIDSAVKQVYETPLSDDGASSESLEGRFLGWLAGGS